MTRSRDVPSFGPPIPKGVTFPKSNVFRDFLLAKVINAENAAHKSEKFRAMATRTRQEYLKDLAEKNVTNTPIDPSGKFPFISLASKKKEKSKPYPGAEIYSSGAIVWSVHAKDYSKGMEIDCLLGVSNEFVVLIEQDTKSVVFNCSCRDVIGWTSTDTNIKIFYERGECVSLESFISNIDDIKEIVKRLEVRMCSLVCFLFPFSSPPTTKASELHQCLGCLKLSYLLIVKSTQAFLLLFLKIPY